MKDTRKAHRWRNVLILQASIAALFLPFVIGLAVMFLLVRHDNRPVGAIDARVTSSTR
ncbi:MAG: hypothetical protein ACTHLC_19660 [Rhizobiaceae bacterium]|jgi:hypothetical protein